MSDILILQAARFGDLIQTARLLESQGNRAVCLAIDKNLVPIAKTLYSAAEIQGLFLHGTPDESKIKYNQEIFAILKDRNFDYVYDCNFSPLTSAICRLFPSDKVIGYRPARVSIGGLLKSPWNRLSFRLGSKRFLSSLNLVDLWGWLVEAPIQPSTVNPAAKPGGEGIGVVVSGRDERRSIPVEILANIIEIVGRIKKNGEIFLFGTNLEDQKARRLMRVLHPNTLKRIKNLCGKTDLPQLLECVSGLELLITPDTGIMHLAAKLGIPVLAFFFASAFCHETGPYGAGHYIFQAVCSCSPCLESAVCPHNLKCLAPFREQAFSRALATHLSCSNVKSLPDGLQLWRTNFDELGQNLELVGGVDKYENERKQLREYVKEYLVLPNGGQVRDGKEKLLFGMVFPDGEWMLPPWRYC